MSLSLNTEYKVKGHKLRTLGTMEEYFWATQQRSSRTIVVAAEIEGDLTVEQWQAAFDNVQAIHPILSVRIRKLSGMRPYFETAPNMKISLKFMPEYEDNDVLNCCEIEMSTPFTADELLVRVAIFQKEGKSTLIFSADHAAFDGKSIVYLLQDLLSSINGEEITKSNPLSPSLDELLGISISENYSEIKSINNTSLNPHTYNIPDISSRYHLQQVIIENPAIIAIRERARLEGTTLHGALTAAILLAGQNTSSRWSGEVIRCASPVDHRKTLAMKKEIGLLVTVSFTEMLPQEKYDLWNLARLITNNINTIRNVPAAANSLSPLRNMMHSKYDINEFCAATMQRSHTLMVTNYGEIDSEVKPGKARITSIMPMVATGHQYTQTVSASTLKDTLTITNVSLTPIPHLLEKAKELLFSQLE